MCVTIKNWLFGGVNYSVGGSVRQSVGRSVICLISSGINQTFKIDSFPHRKKIDNSIDFFSHADQTKFSVFFLGKLTLFVTGGPPSFCTH